MLNHVYTSNISIYRHKYIPTEVHLMLLLRMRENLAKTTLFNIQYQKFKIVRQRTQSNKSPHSL